MRKQYKSFLSFFVHLFTFNSYTLFITTMHAADYDSLRIRGDSSGLFLFSYMSKIDLSNHLQNCNNPVSV